MDLSEKTLIQLLTLQYIQGKTADTALDYVKMYREAEAEIKAAYEATEDRKGFEVTPLAN